MTVTLNLPPDIERAFEGEAQARGLSLDEFLSEVIVSRAEHAAGQSAGAASSPAQSVREEGVPLLHTGQPIGISVVDETLDRAIRWLIVQTRLVAACPSAFTRGERESAAPAAKNIPAVTPAASA